MDRREIERLLEVVGQRRSAGDAVALATVVRVRGQAYRHEGTTMLVRSDGSYECAISGGCLEPAIADAAARVLVTGEPVLASYDLAEDSVWGLQIGCMGAVDIRIERLDPADAVMAAWLSALEADEAAVLVTPLAGVAGRMLVGAGPHVVGALSDGTATREAERRARERLAEPEGASGPEAAGSSELFFHVNRPAPVLAIFGAGHDAVPLARQARALGFSVTIVDPRESLLTADRFPGASLLAVHHSEWPASLRLPPQSYVVVMNHHVERDRASLRAALLAQAAYIGVLGPRARYQKLMADIVDEGFVPEAPALARVRSPVGLSLGAETPEEVALSICAEMLAMRRGFDGGFLNGTAGSLHRASEERRLIARS